jgi:hypothetical protein
MEIQAVTLAIRDLLLASLANQPLLSPALFDVFTGPPGGAAGDPDLILFLYRITPNGELRNAERTRGFPGPTDPLQRFDPAVPLDLHYLVTGGAQTSTTSPALTRLADAIRAIETASPLALPEAFQEAVWLSLEPATTDDLSRIWGLFPNENCRTSFLFRASPVWIDPRMPLPAGPPVVSDRAHAGSMAPA